MKPTFLFLLALGGSSLLPLTAIADDAPRNLFPNGDFSEFATEPNLWDGVDNDGFLAGETGSTRGVVDNGFGELPAPLSVNYCDLNGDGLPDIVTCDAEGYVRVYFNSGTRAAPKFTHAEIVPIFLKPAYDGLRDATPLDQSDMAAPKIALVPWNPNGLLDLVVGNYRGDLFYVPNVGSATKPEFRQPDFSENAKDSALISTSDLDRRWGNDFAPAVDAARSDKDGKKLFVGEGSYSSNAVYLLSSGTAAALAFPESQRLAIAYGEGREDLVPTLADFNGDGRSELIVGDRTGALTLFENPANHDLVANHQFAEKFAAVSTLQLGNTAAFGSPVAPFAADFNGRNLIDLLVGESNGRIALAQNLGSKTMPAFGTPAELGANVGAQKIYAASLTKQLRWFVSDGALRGNLYVTTACVTNREDSEADPAPATRALRIAYCKPENKIFSNDALIFPGNPPRALAENRYFNKPNKLNGKTNPIAPDLGYCASDEIVIRCYLADENAPLPDTDYELSFQIKGRGFKNAAWSLACTASMLQADTQIFRYSRGVRRVRANLLSEDCPLVSGTFEPSETWTPIRKTVRFHFVKYPELNKADDSGRSRAAANFEIRLILPPYDSVFYLDDVKLLKK